jgi:hypothetical protein
VRRDSSPALFRDHHDDRGGDHDDRVDDDDDGTRGDHDHRGAAGHHHRASRHDGHDERRRVRRAHDHDLDHGAGAPR